MDPISIAGYIALVVGSILAVFSRIPKQTISNYEKLSVAQEKRIKALEDQKERDREQHIEQVKAIAELQGQIKVYKELPLQEMALAMQEISRVNKGIADSNTEILKTLKNSALIAAEDRVEEHLETTRVLKKV